MKKLLFTISILLLLTGCTETNFGADLIVDKELSFNDKKIDIKYTDDNTGESLIIKSDKSHYSGWNTSEVYFSIENISNYSENIDIQFYFAGSEKLVSISEFKKDVSYNVEFPKYKTESYICANEADDHICKSAVDKCKNEKESCTLNVPDGTTIEERKRDEWQIIQTKDSKSFSQEIPEEFKSNNSIPFYMPSKEIKFFKAMIEFDRKNNGQFFIFAEGLHIKGKLE